MTPKSISNFEGLYLTFPFSKSHQICTKIYLLFVILKAINFLTADKLGRRYVTILRYVTVNSNIVELLILSL